MSSKLMSQRPGSSAKVYDDGNLDFDSSERLFRSKIPKLPKRTYSLEARKSSNIPTRPGSRHQTNATSQIPIPDWKKCFKKLTLDVPVKYSPKADTSKPGTPKSLSIESSSETAEIHQKKLAKVLSISDTQTEDDFQNFKKNVLRIPEYWTDAGQTVTNILKNAINIVTKQYPSADVETLETEIINILKSTEAIKQEILTKTENIISHANKIYSEGSEEEPSEDDLLKIKKRMEDLQQEVHMRKNVFGDLLKCSSEVRNLIDIEKALNIEGCPKSARHKKISSPKSARQIDRRKYRTEKERLQEVTKKDKTMQSCGDVRRDAKPTTAPKGGRRPPAIVLEDKASQTVNLLTAELHRREEQLNFLNNQILELHQVCKDHISKFKSFNLQIKLRGICNKAQNLSACREIQLLNDEKLQLTEKNNRLQFYNKDLESIIKQRDMDIHQKDRLISQQKKLLHVRDELIEMLKSRCNIEEIQQV